ncbi:hypothetical protein RB199_28845 [Streptomyces libani]
MEVGDALVDRGTHGDGAVLGELLLRREHRLGNPVVADPAEAEGSDGGQGEQQGRQDGDGRAYAAEQ